MGTKHIQYKNNKEKNGLVGWESPVVIHPGEILADFLEDYNLTQVELAERLGITKKTVNEIVVGTNPVTHDTAYKLAKVFNASADFWINLQTRYESNLARLEAKTRIEEDVVQFADNKDVKETYRQLVQYNLVKNYAWISKNFQTIFYELQKYFGVDSLSFLPNLNQAAFRKYKQNVNEYSLAAWLRLGEKKAFETETAPFNEKKLRESLPQIRSFSLLSPEEYLPKLEKVLAECGVVLVCAPNFKNTSAQGAIEWLSPDKAMVILKSVKQGEDRFWFNLFHELGHLLLHSKKETYVDFDKDGNRTKEESEANEFAQKNLVPNLDKFIGSYNDLESVIDGIAKRVGVAKSIVAGQISHYFKDSGSVAWSKTAKYKPSINYTNI